MRALDERPPWIEQDERGVTYAHKIEAADRALDPTRTPAEVERTVRALRPHIGARLPLPGGGFLGVAAAAPAGPTLAPAGGRVRTDGDRLLLDCRGGALELTEIQPPGRARRCRRRHGCAGRPDPALTDFWLDPRLPGRDTAELVRLAVEEWDSGEEWAPYLSALGWRGTPDVLEALAPLADDPDPRARSVAAYVAGQLGAPVRTLPEASAALLERMGEREGDPRVLAVIAEALGHLGEPWGLAWLLRLRRHPDAGVRDGVVAALAGRSDPQAVDALIELSADPEPAIRDWATFALGTLATRDSPELRDALVARLGDAEAEVRIEAVLRAGAARRRARHRAGAGAAVRRRGGGLVLDAPRAPGGRDPAGRAQRRRALRAAPAGARRRLARDDAGARARAGARALRGLSAPTARRGAAGVGGRGGRRGSGRASAGVAA